MQDMALEWWLRPVRMQVRDRRAQCGGVHIVIAQAVIRQGIQVGRMDWAAKAAQLGKAGIIEHNEKYVGGTLLRTVWFRPRGFGGVVRAANHAVEGAAGFVFLE